MPTAASVTTASSPSSSMALSARRRADGSSTDPATPNDRPGWDDDARLGEACVAMAAATRASTSAGPARTSTMAR